MSGKNPNFSKPKEKQPQQFAAAQLRSQTQAAVHRAHEASESSPQEELKVAM